MGTYPWRFQADMKEGETDPAVTVFIGDTFTNDATGEKTVHQGTSDPVIVPLSELADYIATGMSEGIVRKKPEPPTPPGAEHKK